VPRVPEGCPLTPALLELLQPPVTWTPWISAASPTPYASRPAPSTPC